VSDPVVNDAYLGALRAIAELRRASPKVSPAGELPQAWRAAGVVGDKPAQAADKMYGASIDLERLPASLSDAGRAALAEDLRALDPAALVHHYPRDKNGLLLGHTVLLGCYDPAAPLKLKKAPWLVARSPLRRSHPQVIALLLDEIDARGFPAQWDATRWRWDRRAAGAGERERWGVERLPLPLLDAEERAPRIAGLAGETSEEGKAALSLLLLDEGRFAEAFALYGVRVGPALEEALAAHPALAFRELIVEGHGDMGDAYLTQASNRGAQQVGGRWREHLRVHLHRVAPWLLARALVPLTPRGRARPRAQRERLFTLPYGSAARRPAVFLVEERGELTLELDFSGTNTYLPHPRYMRPIELDLLRFGLAT
jgi:hypothetical protein